MSILTLPSGPQVDYTHALAQVRAEQLRQRVGVTLPAPHTLTREEWPPNYAAVMAWRQTKLASFELQPDQLASAKEYYRTHPVDFINHWCNTYDPRNQAKGKAVWMPFVMFEKQAELIEFVLACLNAEASGLVEKSRDMGATWVCVALSVWMWLFWPQTAIGWGSQDADSVDKLFDPKSVLEKIRMEIKSLPLAFLPRGFDPGVNLNFMKLVNPETGATITGDVGDNIGRGGRSLIYFVDEAAHLRHPEAAEAALLDNTRVRIDISSVSGLGTVFHRKREAGLEWQRGEPAQRSLTNVFIMDWSDHPEKTREWYTERKTKLVNEGLPHVFAREIDRDYAAAVEGVIISSDHFAAAIDAHKVLGLNLDEITGPHIAGLDVADAGLDRNGFIKRRGPVLTTAKEWGAVDVGVTARRAVGYCVDTLPIELQYDAIGVGAGVKSEANRLGSENLLPAGLTFVPWVASAAALNPFERVVKKENGQDDEQSPRNKDFYQNLKAQGWWMLRRRFEMTFRAVNEPGFFRPEMIDYLIFIPSTLPLLRQLQKEICQPTIARATSTLKLVVDKTPSGTKSPNLGDATVAAFWPWNAGRPPVTATVAPIIITGD